MKISRIITSLFALFSATKNTDNNDNFTGLVSGSGGGSNSDPAKFNLRGSGPDFLANKFSGEGFNPNELSNYSYTSPASDNSLSELDHSSKEKDLNKLGASSYVSALVSGGFVKDESNINFVEENGCVKMSFFNESEGQDRKSVEVIFSDADNRNKDLQTDFVAGADQIIFGNNGYKNTISIKKSTLPEGTEVLILNGADVSEMCAKFDDEFLNKVAEGSDGKCLILCRNNEKGEREAISSTFLSGDAEIIFDGEKIETESIQGRVLMLSNSTVPTNQPTNQPTTDPSSQPSKQPLRKPSPQPSTEPSNQPSKQPSRQPSPQPSTEPSRQPSKQPSRQPSPQPSTEPSNQPSIQPTSPSEQPTPQPTEKPIRHLSEEEKIGIGFGVYFGVATLIAVNYCCSKYNDYSSEDPSRSPAYATAGAAFERVGIEPEPGM